MSSSFIDDLLDDVISKEGGFVNHPADRGGATKYGITIHTLSRYLGRQATVDDVRSITVDLAKEIYLADYYYSPRINTLNEAVQPKVFDMAVNHGARRAVKILQQVINKAGFGALSVDGAIGNLTRSALDDAHAAMGGYLINALVDERNNFFDAIIARRPSQQVFERGWKNRSNSFRVEVA
jgi:lysozyme family protein